ncbi:MAG: RDD family protein [Actinobacteria bacterium]|nr:RDD family protein [Actinomycetota bacterium]
MLHTTHSVTTPEGFTFPLQIAGVGSRLIAALIDLGLVYLIEVAVFAVLASILFVGGGSTVVLVVLSSVAIAILFGYWAYFDIKREGQTPGRKLCSLQVISLEARPPTVQATTIRTLMRFLDMFPPIGLWAMLMSPLNQRLGDTVAGTVVVRLPRPQRPIVTSGAMRLVRHVDSALVTDASYRVAKEYVNRRTTLSSAARNTVRSQLTELLQPALTEHRRVKGDDLIVAAIVASERSRGIRSERRRGRPSPLAHHESNEIPG